MGGMDEELGNSSVSPQHADSNGAGAAAMSSTENHAAGDGAAGNNKNRILRKGDLAHIIETPGNHISKKKSKLRDRGGQLARILKSHKNDQPDDDDDDDKHPFLYDVELVMGGKLQKLSRADLHYTTAELEGMTGESRVRRKRKANTTASQTDGNSAAAAGSSGNAAAASSSATKGSNAKRQKKSDAQTKASGRAAAKKRPRNGNNDVDRSKAAVSNALNVYERHRRGFERVLGRLEKLDSYGWFLGDVPSEFQEDYFPHRPKRDAETNLSSDKAANMPQHEQNRQKEANVARRGNGIRSSSRSASPTVPPQSTSSSSASLKQHPAHSSKDAYHQKRQQPIFPRHAPYNWKVVRDRMDHGRYELDRQRLEEGEQLRALKPYWKSIGGKPGTQLKLSVPVLHPKGVDWDLFRKDVIGMCTSAIERSEEPPSDSLSAGTISHTAKKIMDTLEQVYERDRDRQYAELRQANDLHRFSMYLDHSTNNQAAMQGKWRRMAFPERKYERLRNDTVCAGLSELDEKVALHELKTSLPNSFLGLSYTYDDTGQSEGWMKSLTQETGDKGRLQKAIRALASDDGVIKAQITASMQTLLIQVQDRVMTEANVLNQTELVSANWQAEMQKQNPSHDAVTPQETKSDGWNSSPELIEQEVWGMDCYTRKNIFICLDTMFDEQAIQEFIEQWLLPAINACPVDLAHDISNAANILRGLSFDATPDGANDATFQKWKSTMLGKALLSKIRNFGPPWLAAVAQLLCRAKDALGPNFFRVHPKGHGSILLSPRIGANRLITYYRGEVYPSWRWGEKMDAISITQERKGLKPVLPDFFNMALERPQTDPRGYSLLFVDASRKSGYGSMLSHSCQPSCEVRVVALNGELRLAMTTIREMKIGEELTFDYNAVTESLNEYQSAVCLCGYRQCRGSFLHFATADCYQQVLTRNSPIAVRLSNLIKGCMKKVMADDDEEVLQRHGFKTAVFGAISVNRRALAISSETVSSHSSIALVPIWLRTFVADTLRYIEYERRALPIALISNQVNEEKKSKSSRASGQRSEAARSNSNGNSSTNTSSRSSASRKGGTNGRPPRPSKPEPAISFFAKKRREKFVAILKRESGGDLAGSALTREVQKLASATWRRFSEAKKEKWKDRARLEWEANSGVDEDDDDDDDTDNMKGAKKRKGEKNDAVSSAKSYSESSDERKSAASETIPETQMDEQQKLSFEGADAEGVSAMEQRIQQLTQALSRVGRVLDRHRETVLRFSSGLDSSLTLCDEDLRDKVHPPMSIMPDETVIAWIWNHPDGVVRQLLKNAREDVCASPHLVNNLERIEAHHTCLRKFGSPWSDDWSEDDDSVSSGEANKAMTPAKARARLSKALLEFRQAILQSITDMRVDIQAKRAAAKKAAERQRKRDERDRKVRRRVSKVMDKLLWQVICKATGDDTIPRSSMQSSEPAANNDETEDQDILDANFELTLEPWLQNYNKRFKLEKAADVLLFYARTSTFFNINHYQQLKSTSIEVYARDLGNEVPCSVIDQSEQNPDAGDVATNGSKDQGSASADEPEEDDGRKSPLPNNETTRNRKSLCEPEDIVSKVVVDYHGDYVLSQLLQWYNGGIGQKSGLPDLLGCALLPNMSGCWRVDATQGKSAMLGRSTRYQSTVRKKLIQWFKDPLQRGSTWPDDIRKDFVDGDRAGHVDHSSPWLPYGSPVLDLLVTGDDCNLKYVTDELDSFYNKRASSNGKKSDSLLSSVDHGRPAQAVSNWVQCENPDCLKWRRVPWHVDIDMLSEKFFCKDNKWNPDVASCDAPEDEWDSHVDAQVVDGSIDQAVTTDDQRTEVESNVGDDEDDDEDDEEREQELGGASKPSRFSVGARFDVMRGKKWTVGEVVRTRNVNGVGREAKIHFRKTSTSRDEWIKVTSSRFAPLHSRTTSLSYGKNRTSSVSEKLARLAKEAKMRKQQLGSRDAQASGSTSIASLSGASSVTAGGEDEADTSDGEGSQASPTSGGKTSAMRKAKRGRDKSSSNGRRASADVDEDSDGLGFFDVDSSSGDDSSVESLNSAMSAGSAKRPKPADGAALTSKDESTKPTDGGRLIPTADAQVTIPKRLKLRDEPARAIDETAQKKANPISPVHQEQPDLHSNETNPVPKQLTTTEDGNPTNDKSSSDPLRIPRRIAKKAKKAPSGSLLSFMKNTSTTENVRGVGVGAGMGAGAGVANGAGGRAAVIGVGRVGPVVGSSNSGSPQNLQRTSSTLRESKPSSLLASVPSQHHATAGHQSTGRIICKQFARSGYCSYGSRCKYVHERRDGRAAESNDSRWHRDPHDRWNGGHRASQKQRTNIHHDQREHHDTTTVATSTSHDESQKAENDGNNPALDQAGNLGMDPSRSYDSSNATGGQHMSSTHPSSTHETTQDRAHDSANPEPSRHDYEPQPGTQDEHQAANQNPRGHGRNTEESLPAAEGDRSNSQHQRDHHEEHHEGRHDKRHEAHENQPSNHIQNHSHSNHNDQHQEGQNAEWSADTSSDMQQMDTCTERSEFHEHAPSHANPQPNEHDQAHAHAHEYDIEYAFPHVDGSMRMGAHLHGDPAAHDPEYEQHHADELDQYSGARHEVASTGSNRDPQSIPREQQDSSSPTATTKTTTTATAKSTAVDRRRGYLDRYDALCRSTNAEETKQNDSRRGYPTRSNHSRRDTAHDYDRRQSQPRDVPLHDERDMDLRQDHRSSPRDYDRRSHDHRYNDRRDRFDDRDRHRSDRHDRYEDDRYDRGYHGSDDRRDRNGDQDRRGSPRQHTSRPGHPHDGRERPDWSSRPAHRRIDDRERRHAGRDRPYNPPHDRRFGQDRRHDHERHHERREHDSRDRDRGHHHEGTRRPHPDDRRWDRRSGSPRGWRGR